MRIAPYFENEPSLRGEFTNCPWDTFTGISADKLEEQIHALWEHRDSEHISVTRARIQRYIVANAQLELNPKSLFPGKFNHGIRYTPVGSDLGGMYERLFKRIREEVLEETMPDLHAWRQEALDTGVGECDSDFWHTMPDFRDVFSLGFPGLKQRLISARDEKAEKGTLDDTAKAFYESALLSLDCIDTYIGRMLAYAKQKTGMEDYIECLTFIRDRKPETLYQAMMVQLIFIQIEEMGCERARTLGIIDQLYYPFYRHDLDNGIYTEEEIKEIFRYFFGRWSRAGRFAAQPFTLCGVDEDGHDAGNELSDLIIDVYDEMNILDPKMHIRYHADFNEKRLHRLLSMMRSGHNAIVLVNDETVIKAYEKLGYSRELARQYTIFGCYEAQIMGKEDAMIGASWLLIPKALEYVMNNGRDWTTGKQMQEDTGDDFATFEDFYKAVLFQLDGIVERIIAGIERQNRDAAMKMNPSPLFSLTIASCVEKGRDAFDGGMEMSNVSVKCHGIGTMADALAAVKVLVYEKKATTFATMKDAILNNWEGYESLRQAVLTLPQKFGNHEPMTDGFARDIYKHLNDLYVGRKANRGGVYRMGGDSITHCEDMGIHLCATPDGRFAHTQTSKNFNGVVGMEKSGLTASLLSATEIDHTDFADACVYDFILHPSAIEGEEGLNALEAAIKVYFARGGYAIQGNVMQVEDLKDAQVHPEKYTNLQVRVCGWNEYFINMSKINQDTYIHRLEVGC